MEKKWLVIYTKPRWEKKVDNLLTRKAIESWCPLNKVERQWSDRKKIIEEPLFKSYVFVNILDEERTEVLRTDGVLNFVYYLGKPAIINNTEISLIKQYLAEVEAKISVISIDGFKEKMKVKVSHGVFMNNTGQVVKANKKKAFVELQSLGQVMIVEFPNEYLTPDIK